MSNKVKDRLRKLALQMTHEERVELDKAMEQLAIKSGLIIVKPVKETGEEVKACDLMMDHISDSQFTEIVSRIKKRKRRVLAGEEASMEVA